MAFQVHRAEAVVDLSAADDTTAYTIDAPGAGFVQVDEIFGRFEEAVASGGFTSTAPVMSLEIGGTEVATFTTGTAATARAIGDTIKSIFTPDESNSFAAVSAYKVSAGDAITLKTKTQGAGGTVTGTIRLYIPMDIDLG